ncbi:D-2-hydroxyacid dehydrogenase [Entomomonas asaccharolytica]|uniref:D-2-hydroxyacid dehydrogenase n=1 Tax=Entomomonas asaccharolytica TaxID=2785331 RepID=A0A974RXJ3_9GAMM|nr:D-2-hydroxyacid dehydrogenase [Entomomonas asaccharolytica]QQP84919.1 D-2-hydroxyacid dehydrogenase [Entomomonas asaccharolytica]
MNKLLIIDKDYSAYIPLVEQKYPDCELFAGNDVASLKEIANQCDIWLGSPNQCADLLKEGVNTPQWIQSVFAGIAPLMAHNLPKDYVLSPAVGVFDQLMAEYVLTYMLAHERQLLQRYAAQQRQHWIADRPSTLHGKQVLIVGAGTIGTGVAKFLKPFGVKLFGIATTAKELPPFEKVGALTELAEYVTAADYVISLLPDTPSTQNIFDAKIFAKMKQGAVFINAGRGTAIVDEELIIALDKGRPSLAVLDVFRTEPLPANHLFWRVPNLLITEHTAAISLPPLVFNLFSRNLERFQKQQPLLGQVDFNQEY